MATVLLHSYSPGPGRGILLNPSPGASPAQFPTSLPALVPSNSSLSSSASSSAPGEDYFSSKSSSSSPSPGPSSSGSPAPRNSMHLHPKPQRHGSNPSTVRRIRFAPLPEPRRDLESTDDAFPPVFDDDADLPQSHDLQPLSLSSALAAATLSLAAPGDSDLSRRTRSLPCSVTSSPTVAKKALPGDSLLLDPSSAQSASASDPAGPTGPDAQHTTAPSELGQEWDVVPSSPALPALSLSAAPDSPRKAGKWSKMLKPLLGRSSHGGNSRSSLTRTTSAEEIAAMNGERGRGLSLLAGSRNSSRSRDTSVSRERDSGRDRRDADFGLPLHRWTSEGQPVLPVSKKKKHSLFGGGGGGGVPLGRTQSLTSLSSKDDRKAAKPVIATNGGRKQQRMLNGRVYGAKRNTNPFANVRSEEPEFVEWGYGGMGSVKASAGQSEIWQRVQKGNVAIGGENGFGARTSAEEDDGSGTAWLKKRREQREREKKEREEKERAEAEAATKAEVEEVEAKSQDAPEEKPVSEAEAPVEAEAAQAEQSVTAPTSANATITSTPAPSTPVATPSHEEHITQTVNIPAPHKRHHHSHSHSHAHTHGHHHHGHSLSLSLTLPHPERRESADTARGVPFASLTPAASATPTGEPAPADDAEGTPVLAGARLRTESITEGENGESLSSSATSTASTTSDDVDDSEESPKDSEGGFGEDDEEEDVEMLKQDRKTAVSAGMEKIARHKEHDHAHEQAKPAEEAGAEASS